MTITRTTAHRVKIAMCAISILALLGIIDTGLYVERMIPQSTNELNELGLRLFIRVILILVFLAIGLWLTTHAKEQE